MPEMKWNKQGEEMKKKTGRMGARAVCCLLLLAVLLAFAQGNNCMAEEGGKREKVTVKDDGALLMEEEADWLKDVAGRLSEKSGFSVVVATCTKDTGKTAQTTCEEYYNSYADGDDGISCLIDMANREIYLATAGEAIRFLTDDRIDAILEKAQKAVSEEDYAQCLYLMILGADRAYEAGEKKKEFPLSRVISVTAAALAVLVFKWFRRRRDGMMYDESDPALRSARQIARRSRMRQQGNRVHTRSRTHIGAGGRKFGGGGRKF